MTRDRRGVFVSYARDDGAAFARRLVLDLEAQGIAAWLDRRELYGGRVWRRQIADAIGDAAYLVLVMTPAALSSEVVAWEWKTARRQGVCVFPIRVEGLDVAAAPRWMRDLHWYTLDEEWETFVEDLRGACETDRVPFMARDLPGSYVRRSHELWTVKRLLIDDRGDPIPAKVVLHGAGGYGKTTLALALALCHDEDVGAAFHDGVLWVSLGQQPALLSEMDRIHRALTGRSSGAVDVQDATRALHKRLLDRRCLLVIDDVWRRSDLDQFLSDMPQCARIVTTRQFDVALEARDSARLRIDKMTEAEALELVTSDLPAASPDREPYRRLVDRLGAWPLLVNLARGALRARTARGATPQAALTAVDEALDRRNLTAFDASSPDDRNEAAAASIAVSLEQLADADVAGWADLAVFP